MTTFEILPKVFLSSQHILWNFFQVLFIWYQIVGPCYSGKKKERIKKSDCRFSWQLSYSRPTSQKYLIWCWSVYWIHGILNGFERLVLSGPLKWILSFSVLFSVINMKTNSVVNCHWWFSDNGLYNNFFTAQNIIRLSSRNWYDWIL